MAKTPDYTQLSVSNLPDEARTWAKDWVLSLNKFLAQTVAALKAIPSAPAVKELSVLTGSAVADSFPIDFPNPIGESPNSVVLAYISTPGSSVTSAVMVHWTMLAGDIIRISLVTGLSASTQYTIRLVIS